MVKRFFLTIFFVTILFSFDIAVAKTEKFMSVSDIHFDPFAGCEKLSRPCEQIIRLRAAEYSKWPEILEKDKRTIVYHRDTSYPLFQSTLAELKKIKQQENPKFVVILGDFLAHDFGRQYKRYSGDATREGREAFIKKTMKFLSLEIKKVFTDIDVYPALGNNDSYRGDYSVSPRGDFLRDTASIWSQLIKDKENQIAFRKSFPIGGYYAVTLPTGNKLLMLDTVLFSSSGKTSKEREAAAKEELDWLRVELKTAAMKKQKVLLAAHIPESIDVFATLKLLTFVHQFWRPVYSKEFDSILTQYSKTITGALYGHTHINTFQLIALKNGDSIPAIFTSSVSPIFGNNPGFKVFSYDTDTLKLKNFETYYYPLNYPSWQKEYSFNQSHQARSRALCAGRG